MWIAVIPAYNEANTIKNVLEHLLACHCFECLLFVTNGCTDATEETIREAAADTQTTQSECHIELLSFPEPLGIDVPRAVGAAYVQKKYHASGIVFVDGDLSGRLTKPLLALLDGLNQGLDLALTNCYPPLSAQFTQTPETTRTATATYPAQAIHDQDNPHSSLAETVLYYRQLLNDTLGLSTKIGQATPSHGPHAISARLLAKLPLPLLAIPPLTLAFAARQGYNVSVAATIPHQLLGSKIRSDLHATNIAATIIADCQQALAYIVGTPWPDLIAASVESCAGYQRLRRFDLLEAYCRMISNACANSSS